VTDFEIWLAYGRQHKYLVETCLMHDLPTTEAEEQEVEDGLEPCFPRYIVRPELVE
jgi:hypothetical protein